jgi:hypothetical protein
MELTGAEAVIVPALKLIMLAVMVGGGIAVFREIVPMARGRTPVAPKPAQEEQE